MQAYATAQRCFDLTMAWVRDRETFGRPLSSRQVVRHKIAEMARQIDVARTLHPRRDQPLAGRRAT